MNLLQAFSRGLAKSDRVYGGAGHRGGTAFRLGSTGRDWQSDAGDLHANSVVSICLNWTVRKLAQTRLQLEAEVEPEEWQAQPQPDWLQCLRTPNDAHDEHMLWSAATLGFVCNGNAYWLKRRDNLGRVIGYNPVYHRQMRAESTDPKRYVTNYVYTPIGGNPENVDPMEVVHYRWPVPDPINPALGLSPLAALVRQVFGLNEAVNWEASMLGNAGWPSLILVPKALPEKTMTDEGRKRLKERWMEMTGDRRGEPLVAPAPMDVVAPPYKPNEMMLDKSRNLNAADVCAALGLDPMAVHLFSESKTYANAQEMREDAIESGMLPSLMMLARQFQASKAKDPLVTIAPGQRLMFALGGFRELQEDEDKRRDRNRKDWLANITTLGEVRKKNGEKDDTEDERRYSDFKPAPPQVASAVEADPKAQKAAALAGIRRMAAENRA